ncbi:hypothetical protein [Ancylobacter vacuolatus]|uniref:Flagellar basal body-associated FliL family protein n=1 Tax=Ancylobacter vacuolatus TaxID=223389 RepID=A0ABU0DKF4_9HYPH|nr:hypothetical protein [Ancylobacter vacuolatus]MDQ0348917.1 hypothetical protein [Ancylobacter vacuolatus]
MMRLLFIGLWVCLVTLLASYGGAYWMAGSSAGKDEEPFLAGLEYRRLEPINVPMIIDGTVRGYVIAKLVFTADAATLRQLPIEPQIFVTHAAFQEIYTEGRVEFGKLSKYNLSDMLNNIRSKVNEKLNGDVIKEILVDGINYIDKSEIRALVDRSGDAPKKTSAATGEKATH